MIKALLLPVTVSVRTSSSSSSVVLHARRTMNIATTARATVATVTTTMSNSNSTSFTTVSGSYCVTTRRSASTTNKTATLSTNHTSSSSSILVADRCNLHIVQSPFSSIPVGPYPPLYEFISSQWWKPSLSKLEQQQQPSPPPPPKTKNSDHSSTSIRSVYSNDPDDISSDSKIMIDKDQLAIVDGSTGLQRTYEDYYYHTTALAYTLRNDLNVNEHTTVALYCGNHVDYLPIVLSVSICGAKVTPINPLYTSRELQMILDRSHSSILFVHESKLDVAIEAIHHQQRPSMIQYVIVITDQGALTVTTTSTSSINSSTTNMQNSFTMIDIHSLWQDRTKLLQHTTTQSHYPPITTHSHPVVLPYSSGTTGLPKGVCLTHENIVVNLLQLAKVEQTNFLSHHRLITPLPFFHIYAFTVSLLYTAWQGQTLITTSGRFDLEFFCSLIQQYQPHRAHLVPPIMLGLAKHPIVDQYNLSSLQMIISAAAPLGSDIETQVKARLGCMVKQGWGMSELSPLGTLSTDETAKPGSVGHLMPSTIAKVVNEDGSSLGPNENGELYIHGPQVMMGYLNDPEQTAQCLSPTTKWLRTGDMAHYDTDGCFYITDRMKELIKVRGYQVAPAELEALLLTHPAISDVAVISIPDDSAGELPRAYVVLRTSSTTGSTKQTMVQSNTTNPIEEPPPPPPPLITQQELKDWVKDRVASFKRLEGGIEFVSTIPKSASGKILRRILRDQYNNKPNMMI